MQAALYRIICDIVVYYSRRQFLQGLVHAELLQEQSEESDFAEDMDEALSELDLSDLEQFVSDNLSKTHIGFGELVRI